MSWFLERDRADFLEKEVKSSIDRKKQEVNRNITYKDHVNILTEFMDQGYIHENFLINVIWFFHRCRLDPSYLNILESFIENFQKAVELQKAIETEAPSSGSGDFLAYTNTLINIFTLEFQQNRLDTPSIASCLSAEEKDRINKKITDFEEISFLNEKAGYLDKTKQMKILEKFSKSSHFEKVSYQLDFLMDIATSSRDESTIAEAPLNYLLEENDVISDDYGIFGLVDDVYAISESYYKLRNRNDLGRLVQIFNHEHENFYIPNLQDENKPISLVNVEDIVKAALAKENEDYFKRLLVLSDIGPLPIFIALGKAIIERQNHSHFGQDDVKFDSGENLVFFNEKNDTRIVATYAGKRGQDFDQHLLSDNKDDEVLNDMHALWVDKDKNSIQYVTEAFIKTAKPTSRRISTKKNIYKFFNSLEEKPLNHWARYNFPEGITSIRHEKKLFILGQKNKILDFLDLNLFNKSIKSWLGLREFTKDGKCINHEQQANQLFPDPYIYLFADSGAFTDALENQWHETCSETERSEPELIITCEDNYLRDEYLLDTLKRCEADVLVLSSFINNYEINKTAANSFDQIPVKPNDYLSDLDISGIDPVSRFFSRSKDFKISIENTKNNFIENFYSIRNLLKDLLMEERHKFIKRCLYRIIENLQNRILPLNEEEKVNFQENFEILLNELHEISANNSKVKRAINLLADLKQDAEDFHKFEEIKDFCIKNNELKTVILCHKRQKERLNRLISEEGLNAMAETFTNLEKIEIGGKILVAIAQKREISQKLKMYRYAQEICFLLNDEERKSHLNTLKRLEKYFNNYFPSSEVKEEIIEEVEDFSSSFTEESIDFTYTAAKSKFSGETDSSVEAKMLLLDDEQIYFSRNRRDVLFISRRRGDSIEYGKTEDLLSGDKIVISEEFSGNEILHLLMNKEEKLKYPELEGQAQIWQDKLKEYKKENHMDIYQLTAALKDNGVDRHFATVRNWLSDPETISPRSFFDLQQIFKLVGEKDSKVFSVCKDKGKEVYRLRNECKKRLLEKLQDVRFDVDQDEISLIINEKHISFGVYEINATKDIVVESSHLHKIQNLDQF